MMLQLRLLEDIKVDIVGQFFSTKKLICPSYVFLKYGRVLAKMVIKMKSEQALSLQQECRI